jgi:antitoxin CptB
LSGADTARIRWRCRRGIKELDVLMERFTEECLPRLAPGQTPALDRLLDESDLDLLDWIIGRYPPRSPEYLPLLEMLRGLSR